MAMTETQRRGDGGLGGQAAIDDEQAARHQRRLAVATTTHIVARHRATLP